MEVPIGFVTLQEAVDLVGKKVGGDADVERVIAKACESGKLAAAYRNYLAGADELGRGVWHMPHWRNYFAAGTIDLDLPYVNESGPILDGRTVRCYAREIFIREDSLGEFVKSLEPAAGQPKGKGGRPRKLDHASVAAEVHRLMDHHGEFSSDDPEWNAQARLIEAVRKKFGEASDSTLEGYIKEPLAAWRNEKAASPKT